MIAARSTMMAAAMPARGTFFIATEGCAKSHGHEV